MFRYQTSTLPGIAIVLLCFVFALQANSTLAQKSDKNLLNEFESLCWSSPDSTLGLLNKYREKKLKKQEEEQLDLIQGWIYNGLKQPDSAMIVFEGIINNQNAYKNKFVVAEAFLARGLLFDKKGLGDSAKIQFENALSIGRVIDDVLTISTACNELGYISLGEGKFDIAEKQFAEAYKYQEILKDTMKMASCMNNLFVAQYRLGKFEQATESLLKSIELKERFVSPKSYISSLINLSNLYIRLESYDDAEVCCQNAYALSQQNLLTVLEAKAATNLGVVTKYLNKPDSAIVYYEKALQLSDSIGYEKGSAVVLQNLGVLYNNRGENRKSFEYSTKALALYRKLNIPREIAICCCNISAVSLDMNELQKAKIYLAEAQELSDKIGTKELYVEVNKCWYRYYKKNGENLNALNHLELFNIYNDSLNSIETEKTIRNLERKYQAEKKQAEIEQLEASNHIKTLKVREKESEIQTQRTIFIFVAGIVILLVVLAFLLFQRYKLRQKNIKSELQRQRLEIEQRMIRTQMNPHFTFNSLASIQNLVNAQRLGDAQKYLSKFASLLRLVLENSRHEFVALDQEIKSLRNFIEIEQLRFEGKFSYEIDDATDEAEFIAVPPMLMQPFVENAIIHGLKAKEEKGFLKVSYSIDDEDMLICTVEDDGVGRKVTKQNSKTRGKKHNSLALKLIKERIEILRHEWDSRLKLDIVDVDEKGKTGTKVVLKLPVKDL